MRHTTADPPPVKRVSLSSAKELCTTYLESSTKLSPETLLSYRHHLNNFLDWWANSQWSTFGLSATILKGYRAHLDRKALTLRSRGLRLAAVRSWCSFLKDEGYLATSLFDDIPSFKKPDSISGGYLTEHEIHHFQRIFTKTDLFNYRDYVIARLMLKTGIRESELCRAQISDISPVEKGGTLFLYSKGKGEKEEELFLTQDLYHELRVYLRWRRRRGFSIAPHEPLFIGHRETITPAGQRLSAHEVRRRLTLALRQAGLVRKSLTVLSLRHTAAISAFRNGASEGEVQKMMRHEDPRTTVIYQRLASRLEGRAEPYLTITPSHDPAPTTPAASEA